MKTIRRTTFFILLTCFISISYVDTGLAKSQHEGANLLVQVGVEHYEKGELDQAIHEFSKALMLDPNHSVAKEYLAEFGMEEGLYPGMTTKLTRVADMATQIAEYKKKLVQMEQEKMDLEKKISRLERRDNSEEMVPSHKMKVVNQTLESMSLVSQKSKARPHVTVDNNEDPFELFIRKQRDGWKNTTLPFQHIDEAIPFLDDPKNVLLPEDYYESKASSVSNVSVAFGSKNKFSVDSDVIDGSGHDELLDIVLAQEKLLQKHEREGEKLSGFDNTIVYQNTMINVLEDYLSLREERLADAEDELVFAQLDLISNQLGLLYKHEELLDVYNLLGKNVQ